jgi:hypothetical protein
MVRPIPLLVSPVNSESSLLLDETDGGLRIAALNTSTLPRTGTPPAGF